MEKQEIKLHPKALCEPRDSTHAENRKEELTKATDDFTSKVKIFLKECLNRDLLLEGLLMTGFLENSDLVDVFQTGIAKATHYSDLGDLQTILSVIKQFCASLHRKRKHKKQHIVNWCEQNGIKEEKLKAIDKQLRDSFTNLNLSSTANHCKENPLTFHKDATFVHETITRAMLTTWHEQLCVYQGHEDLGYIQMSSKRSLLVDPKSCFRLTNSPPTFALCFPRNIRSGDENCSNDLKNSAYLIIKVDEELAGSILAKCYNTSTVEVLLQFACVPITVGSVGFELGTVAAKTLNHQLRQIFGNPVLVEYNPDDKDILIFCPPSMHAKVQLTAEAVLERLRLELEAKEMQFQCPNRKRNSLALHIGGGFKCTGIAGIHWRWNVTNHNVVANKSNDSSFPYEYNYLSALYATERQCEQVNCEKKKTTSHCLLLTDDKSKDNCCHWKTPKDQDRVYYFDSTVEVTAMFFPRANFGSTHANCVRSQAIYATRRMFALAGLKVDNGENSIAIWAEDESGEFKVRLKIVFPNLTAAAIGVKCIENNPLFSLGNREQVSTDLKTVRIAIINDLYPIVRNSLHEKLDALVAVNKIDGFREAEPTFRDTMSFDHAANVCICIQKSEKCSLLELANALAPVFRCNQVKTTKCSKLRWLRRNEGKQFLKFVMTVTGTFIHFPQFQKKLHIYGNLSNRIQAVAILKNDLDMEDDIAENSKFKWYVVDFAKRNYLPDSAKIWSDEFKLTTDEMVKSGQMKSYVICEDRPELWFESTFDTFVQYTHKIFSRVEIVQTVQSSLNSDVQRREEVCSVCFDTLNLSLENCCILSVCGHAYCDECLAQMVEQSAEDRRFPVTCAKENCNRMLTVYELQFLCGEYYYCNIANLLKRMFEGFVMENGSSMLRCHRLECGGFGPVVEDVRKVRCFMCGSSSCVECERLYHGDSRCDEDYNIMEWVEADRANRWMCPICKIPIEKFGGCNLVHCSLCQTIFCWDCDFLHCDYAQCHYHYLYCKATRRSGLNRV